MEVLMKQCPKCKDDFIDDSTECNTCKIPLISKSEIVETVEEIEKIILTGTEKLLVKIDSESDAEAIKLFLKEHDIDVLFKYEGIGGYMKIYMGASVNTMIEIYVLEEEYDKASKLLLATDNAEEVPDDFFEDESDVSDYKSINRYLKFRKVAKWILLGSFVAPFIFILFTQLSTLF